MTSWKQDLKSVLIAVTVGHLVACGQVAVDGLEKGENRLELTGRPPGGDGGDPTVVSLGMRVFEGEYQEPVVVGERERVLFVSKADAQGQVKAPVFHASFKVEPGASLVGSASFRGGIEVRGTSGAQVLWQLDPKTVTTFHAPQIEYAVIVDGGIEIQAKRNFLSLLTQSRLEGVSIRAAVAEGGKFEISWSNLVNADTTVTFSPRDIASTPGPRSEALRFASNDSRFSTLRLPQATSNSRLFWLEANNFRELDRDQTYFFLAADVESRRRLREFSGNNHFALKSRLAQADVWAEYDQFDVDWIRDDFLAGQNGNQDVPVTDAVDPKRIISDVWLGVTPSYFTVFGSDHDTVDSYTLEWNLRRFLREEVRNYSLRHQSESDRPVSIRFELEAPQGCTVTYEDEWGGKQYECAGFFTLPLSAKLEVDGEQVAMITKGVEIRYYRATHSIRTLREASIGLLGFFVDEGFLTPVEAYTPYF